MRGAGRRAEGALRADGGGRAALRRAYASLLRVRLAPALDAELWCDDENYAAVARPAFGVAAHPPPLGAFLAWRRRRWVAAAVDGPGARRLLDGAKDALAALASRLGERRFLLGDEPCWVDAMAYGYLSRMLEVELPHPLLAPLVRTHDSLVAYVARVAELAS